MLLDIEFKNRFQNFKMYVIFKRILENNNDDEPYH